MYEDAWYNAFVPSSQPAAATLQTSKHRRRESLLKQPNESSQADTNRAGGIGDIVEEPESTRIGPPAATVARRAKSYSDFYDVVRAQIKSNIPTEKTAVGGASSIKSELEFGDWYHQIEDELLEASQEEYQSYQDQLCLFENHLDSLLASTNSTLDLLSSLAESFQTVEAQTTAFQAQCQGLLADQRRITDLADDLGENLQFYRYLEPITKRLNAPGAGNFVRGKEFSEMLANLDRCLEYTQAHPGHREAQTYRSRYRLLLTRALTLIRVHFVNSLKDIAVDVSKRIADRQLNDTTMSALLYAKFRVGASELKEVGQEIQKRAVTSFGAEPGAEAEYQSLMNELYQSYSSIRGRLVIPIVRKKIGDIAMAPSTANDLVAFARTSIGYIRGMCFDEYELWVEWFEDREALYEFLETLFEPVYDYLRPRIIHENQLIKLCELCTLLQTRYMSDQEEDPEPLEDNQLDFSLLVQPTLEDAQTRLVFRAQAVLRDEIENYRPKAEDLKYPPRMSGDYKTGKSNRPATSGRKDSVAAPTTPMPQTPLVVDKDGDGDGNTEPTWNLDTESTSKSWYPTLKKAIWLLSRIYRLVNSTVFDDLAHQIVHQTTLSLHLAASQINTKATNLDAQLFLIKHLLILKQQIVAFDIEFVTSDVSFDFSGVTNTFWELRERGGLFNPRNLLRFVNGGLLPRVVENMLDAKAELDGRLRTVINEFTRNLAGRMTSAVGERPLSKGGADRSVAAKAVKEAIEKEVPLLRRKLNEYLDDFRTKETLVGAVQDQAVQNYETFYEKYSAALNGNGKAAGRNGKGREEDIWDVDTFAEWTDGVFRVGRVSFRGADVDSRSISRSGSM
ncbi:MAG: Golgi transport complex subunit 3 [Candelina mexicana]|nr:MAG: Golgi transport complex subunit 3 [Candelina mexicana]